MRSSPTRAHGVLWVNAAGNEARHHWVGRYVDADGAGYLDFAQGADGNWVSVAPGGYVCAYLRWYEWPRKSHDYGLSLYDADSGLVEVEAEPEGAQPAKRACWGNYRLWDTNPSGIEIRISAPNGAGAAPLDLFVEGAGEIQHWTARGSVADPATSSNALAVGAICWQTRELEFFSSEGPTIDGRTKPDLVAPDSVSSFTYGPFSRCAWSGFAGTSAAAPYVAGAAALVKQRFPSYGPARIEAYLE
jgi:subtilisin family serine protease